MRTALQEAARNSEAPLRSLPKSAATASDATQYEFPNKSPGNETPTRVTLRVTHKNSISTATDPSRSRSFGDGDRLLHDARHVYIYLFACRQQVRRQQFSIAWRFTFYADYVVPDLLSHQAVWYQIDQVVDRVNGRMHALEPLDLLSDGQGVVQEGLQVGPRVHLRRQHRTQQREHGKFDCTHEATPASVSRPSARRKHSRFRLLLNVTCEGEVRAAKSLNLNTLPPDELHLFSQKVLTCCHLTERF